jgi:ATP-dependent Lon protease
VALASLLGRQLIRPKLAMTGEISLRGRILPVAGIKEKVLAAVRSGLKEVILPELNRSDWLEIPEQARHKIKVHFVRHIAELIPLALQPR